VAEAADGTCDRAEAADFAAVLRKPFDLDELLNSVTVACKRSVA
jgi:DNA-binding response OmpR family regulator